MKDKFRSKDKSIEKENIRTIKALKKQGKYEEIYQIYGVNYFRKFVSSKYKRQDIKKLEQEGKFLDIYNKYGSFTFKAYQKDFENETGKKPNIFQILKYNAVVRKDLGSALKDSIFYISAFTLSLGFFSDLLLQINSFQNKNLINNYNKKIIEDTKDVKSQNLSDLEIFMKLMNDLYEDNQGYGTPKIDIRGFYGIDFMNENGIGVCRNMADYIRDKLNAINPNYNARTVTVLSNYSYNIDNNNIEMKRLEDDGTIVKRKGNITCFYKDNQLYNKIVHKDNTNIEYIYENGKLKEKYENIFLNGTTITKKYNEHHLEHLWESSQSYYHEKSFYKDTGSLYYELFATENEQTACFYNKYGNIFQRQTLRGDKLVTEHLDSKGFVMNSSKKTTDIKNSYIEKKLSHSSEQETQSFSNIIFKVNHAVVLVDIVSDNSTIVLDPTNTTIGVYKDGKMIMFNETDKDRESILRSFLGDVYYNGTSSLIDYPFEYVSSFLNSSLSLEELEKKYGVTAQNKALEKVKMLDKSSDNNFKQDLKVQNPSESDITYSPNTGKLKFGTEEYDIQR